MADEIKNILGAKAGTAVFIRVLFATVRSGSLFKIFHSLPRCYFDRTCTSGPGSLSLPIHARNRQEQHPAQRVTGLDSLDIENI